MGIQIIMICTEGRSVSDLASESSSNNSSRFGDDESDSENGYDEEKW